MTTIQGTTSLYGYLLSTTDPNLTLGSPATATIERHDGQPFTLTIPPEAIQSIRDEDLIAKDVGFEGIATWRVDTWEMLAFEADRLNDYRPHLMTLSEAFEALRVASGGRWDNVDVEAFMREMRGDD